MSEASIYKIRASRVNSISAEQYDGYEGLIWYDTFTGELRIWDNNVPGGRLIYNNGPGTTNKLVNGAYELVLDASGNVTAPGAISAVGNITANYFVGNGSQLTGINVSTNKIFNGNSYANVAVANGNVEINANGQSWNFDTAGNITLPTNTSSINYANGTPYGGSGNVTAGNVTIQNQGNTLTTAVNTINFTGNGVSATNVGNVVTVNVTAGSGTLPSQTGNAGKILTTNGTDPLWETMPGVFGLVIDGGDAAYASPDFIIDGGTAT